MVRRGILQQQRVCRSRRRYFAARTNRKRLADIAHACQKPTETSRPKPSWDGSALEAHNPVTNQNVNRKQPA
eukprot:483607-Amphidinium_carterae.1